MISLAGAKIVLLEARMSSELAEMVRRFAGEPVCVPAVREAQRNCEAAELAMLRRLAEGQFAAAIFQTGVGVSGMLAEAERQNLLEPMLLALRQMTTICRGPKPSGVLRRHSVPITASAAAPYTTAELIAAIDSVDLRGKPVLLTHYGERNAALTAALHARGADTAELCLYEWMLPEDCAPLRDLVRALIARQYDALAITSQVQIRHLFQIAGELGLHQPLREALSRTVLAAVGPTCAAAFAEYGLPPHVMPENPKMGPMLHALADYLSALRSPSQPEVLHA